MKKLNNNQSKIPTFDALMLPTLKALQLLGGSGTGSEIFEKVVEIEGISDDILNILHGTTSTSEVEYRLGWSRTYLKKYGLIDNSKSVRGVWAIVDPTIEVNKVDVVEIVRSVRESAREKSGDKTPNVPAQVNSLDADPVEQEEAKEIKWQERLLTTLRQISPDAFERLAQRMLRESGFVQVEVTGRSGDGGIDGVGIVKIAGFLSFHVLFQCKRYQGSVTSEEIRSFRGAMSARTDKGLFITTGSFTRDAVKEAARDGAHLIDLIDGEELVQRLKELKLGVKINMVETVEVDEEWFAGI